MQIEDSFLPILITQHGQIKSCNHVFSTLLGLTSYDVINLKASGLLHLKIDDEYCDINTLFDCSKDILEDEVHRGELVDCNYYHIKVEFYCKKIENNTFKLSFRVTENKAIDPISGLPNGWAMSARATHLFNTQNTHSLTLRMLVVSVDNFSTINFRYGFDTGDEYLAVFGKHLQSKLQHEGLVVRFSNARFGILIENRGDLSPQDFIDHITTICQNLCQWSLAPLCLTHNLMVNKSISIGISAEHSEYDNYFAMEIAAETAMRESERHSNSYYYFAKTTIKPDLMMNKLIIDEFPVAIENSRIKIHYQPQYELTDNKLVGFEALSRWIHPDLGYIAPDVFVRIAEDIGLHFEFDLWVFTQVCKQIVQWREIDVNSPRIAINISFKTLEMTSFVTRLQAIINNTGCPKNLLEIEVTETASITNMLTLIDNVRAVKALGLHIAIDDFGTGYSSLSLVRTLRSSLDTLKIDRSLIADICDSKLDREFARKVIGLGEVLEVKVLAEGVETSAQRDLLQALGCDYAQGYYFDKALSDIDAKNLIINQNFD
ncbi:bifunctional diguanylate cyclase/phosphodiesterase [Moritella marina ATCC 15381]|uniref:Bifunctional diguanylate cyclase/phosphodiesterase n=1 Tax=Moritella marina ATCC 15381 TaxID=1202962 RepID=A0A5J6WLE2_MORMI|nr:bifunctional diguanylate cyclase/phosphodiesterase [Moritella marina]QFI37625.1 bifunctional diguanylate cyclase/phosphodiesterase [Moritella marina ATCC 15381]